MTATELPPTTPEPKSFDPDYWNGVDRCYIPSADLRLPPNLRLYNDRAAEVDPITREVIRYALINANLEHSNLLQRLCAGPGTRIARDFQTSILTGVGDLVFLGPNFQYFSNSQSLAIKWTLEHRADDPGIQPGDMWFCNDPFICAPHHADACIAAPVFVGDELFCWVANSLHYIDIGGNTPGSFCLSARDTWDEPMNWPPVKLMERHRVRRDVAELFIRQSRLPDLVSADFHAALATNGTTRKKIENMLDEYGPSVVNAVMESIVDGGEALFAERLESIPDGRWSHRVYTEAANPGDRGVYAAQVNITKRDGRLIVDNIGTDPQVGAINCPFVSFAGGSLAAITQAMVPDLAGAYGGVYRAVEFRPISGLLNCPEYPAAVSPSGAVMTENQINAAGIAVSKMLACGDEEARKLILGASVTVFAGVVLAGTVQKTPFVFLDVTGNATGLGATAVRDGIDAGGHYWIPNARAQNAEETEDQYPLLWLYRRFIRAGADGAGRHRGGLGLEMGMTPYGATNVDFSYFTNEAYPKGQGILGGNPGSFSRFRLIRESDVFAQMERGLLPSAPEEVAGNEQRCGFWFPTLAGDDGIVPGDFFHATFPSMGGFGDPLRRDPAEVLRDVRAGILGTESALAVHAVVIVGDGIDEEATEASRLGRRRDRLGYDPGPEEIPPPVSRRSGEILYVHADRWWCNGADLGPTSVNYKLACPTREVFAWQIAPEFESDDRELAERVLFREYFCPVTGYRLDAELLRRGDKPLHDIAIFSAHPADC